MSSIAPYVDWLKSLFEGLTIQQKIFWGTFTSACLYGLYIIFRNFVPPRLPLRSVPVLDKRKPRDETAVRRSVLSPDKLISHIPKWPEVKTMCDLLKKAAKTYGNNPCLGYRDLIKIHKETKEVATRVEGEVKMVKKDWYYEERSRFHWLSYKGTQQRL